MNTQSASIIIRPKGLGFAQGNQMKLYGETFEVAGETVAVAQNVVLVDAIEKKSGQLRRVRIPLPTLKMAADRAA